MPGIFEWSIPAMLPAESVVSPPAESVVACFAAESPFRSDGDEHAPIAIAQSRAYLKDCIPAFLFKTIMGSPAV